MTSQPMNRDALRRLAGAFDPTIPIARAWTPPSGWYTDAALYELERASVFRRSWQPVARAAEIGEAGSYVAGCFAGEPWLVVRGGDGAVRAFANVCRHKGREVVTGSGRADELVCGYHAWTYALDGTLRRAPRVAGIQDFDRGRMSLPALGVEIWGPWVFVNGDPGAPSLRAGIPELDALLERGGWSALRHAGRRSWEIACNWKVYVDNYLDGGYHVPHMHPTLDAQLDMRRYRTETFGRFSIQSCPAAAHEDGRIGFDAAARIGEGAVYAWIYPNLMLNRYGSCLDSNHVVPLAPDRCRVDYDFFFFDVEGDDARRRIAESMAQSDVTQREDIEICESVQRGLGSASYERGRYAPEVEIAEHHFHALLAADYAEALAGRP
jgi:choline monooxygenase